MRTTCVVNATGVDIEHEAGETLLSVLRARLGLTGAKLSCDMQVCGVCTVLVDDLPVSSCTLLFADCAGGRIRTVEGLAADGKLHPVQKAFLSYNAFQCGYCTPGQIMTCVALLEHGTHFTYEQVTEYLSGTLCRCTGYLPIRAAAEAARSTAATTSGEK